MEDARVDVLIITALKDELDAVLAAAPARKNESGWELVSDKRGFPYHIREFLNEYDEPLRIAAAWAGEKGESAATRRAMALINELNPACLAMCGICAGKRGETSLGDVIVADRVFSYDHGKLIAHQGGDAEFFRDIKTYNLRDAWAMRAHYFAEEFQRTWEGASERPPSKESQKRWLLHAIHAHERDRDKVPAPANHSDRKARCPDWKQQITELRKEGLITSAHKQLQLTGQGLAYLDEDKLLYPDGPEPDREFRVLVGPIATGKAVREEPNLFQLLERHTRKVLGVEMEAAAIGAVAEQVGRTSIAVKAVSDYADHDKDDSFRSFACKASAEFLLRFLRRNLSASDEIRSNSRYEFLARVEKVCRLRWDHPGTILQRRPAPAPFERIIEVVQAEHKVHEIFPVVALEQELSEELLEAFDTKIATRYRRENRGAQAFLIHTGHTAPERLARKAASKRINLYSFEEFQGLIDFSTYVERQTARLSHDHVYRPEHYVEQPAQVLIEGAGSDQTGDVLSLIRESMDSQDARFLLVLGDFGTGKTFLLRELARRMGQGDSPLVPVLLEMRALQKALDLKALIAQHFAVASMRNFSVDRFLYMLHSGRVALLFDGFDELELRVTYDQVLEHFGTISAAVQERAKVILTSRTQHFLTDHDVKRQLALRAAALPGYRIIKLGQFGENQIRQFLVKRLGSEPDADRRLSLLKEVKDLRGLSENPRLLSFIVDLDPKELEAARAGAGEITSASLYKLLIEKWLKGEHERVNPPGAPKGLSLQQLRSAATGLAMMLWVKTERTVEISELPEEFVATINARGPYSLEAGVVRHQLGSGSLLVRDADGRFSFVHQSVMEWLVAEEAAVELRGQREPTILTRGEISELMADFIITLAGAEAVRAWAARISVTAENDIAKKNALQFESRLRARVADPATTAEPYLVRNFDGSDLRGQDLSRADLRNASLQQADLSGATLVEANLEGASLRGAVLAQADLEKAQLGRADLTGAVLSRARLLGADLRGATFRGTVLRAAKLIGAMYGSLEGCDVLGAALPGEKSPVPTVSPEERCFAVAFSAKDELLATGHGDGTVCLWDAVTGKALRLLEGYRASVRSVAFSPDGAILASAFVDQTVALWRVADGEQLSLLRGHRDSTLSVAFSPDGTTLASASDDRTVALWRVADGERLRGLKGHRASVLGVAFSPDGTLLATASADRTVALWRVADGEQLRLLQGHEDAVHSIAFSPNGAILASASADQTVALWRVADGGQLRLLKGHRGPVCSIAFSPDGALLASASGDRTVALWTVTNGELLLLLEGHRDSVRSIAFSPDGAMLASASDDRTVALWRVANGERLRLLEGRRDSARSVAFSPDGVILASASEARTVGLWRLSDGKRLRLLKGHRAAVSSVAFCPDGATLASASDDQTVALWRVPDGEQARLLEGHQAAVSSVVFSPDGSILASASADRTVALWRVKNGKRLRLLEGHGAAVNSVVFSPDGTILASASADRTAALWRATDGKRLRLLDGSQAAMRSVAFSPDGGTLALSSADRTVALWRVKNGKRLQLMEGHENSVNHVTFNPDGRILASASADRTVALWHVADGKRLRLLKGHRAAVSSVAFSRDGATLASASADGMVRLWDVATGRCLATLLGLRGGWVTFRPDGSYKFEGRLDGVFWHVSGLCRFEIGELDPYLLLRIPEGESLLPNPRTRS